MSNPTEDDWKKMTQLVDTFYRRADAEPFQLPVDWKTFGLTDYPQIIKNPMDLGTVKQRLKNTKSHPRHYKTLYQCAADVRTVWTNCMTYNADGSDFYKLAESLQKKWDERYTKLLHECSSGGGGGSNAAAPAAAATKPSTTTSTAAATNSTTTTDAAAAATAAAAASTTTTTTGSTTNKVTLADKKAFCRLLYQISKQDVGRILADVEVKCPSALIRNNTEQQVELNVDQLPAAVLHDLSLQCLQLKKTASAAAAALASSTTTTTTASSSTTNNNALKKKNPPPGGSNAANSSSSGSKKLKAPLPATAALAGKEKFN